MLQTAAAWLSQLIDPLRGYWFWYGFAKVGDFLATHLISAMVPAFFLAGAIAVFLDKQRITKYMGPEANPLFSYPMAAVSGGVLTVCSCGVIPIFTSILSQGAGVGPAFTFLMASPAVNLIALSYTYSLLGIKFMLWRGLLVMASAIGIGLAMRVVFGAVIKQDDEEEPCCAVVMADEEGRSDFQLIVYFACIVLIMITATGFLDTPFNALFGYLGVVRKPLPRLLGLAAELIFLIIICIKWFEKEEIILWLKKSKSLFCMIFPKIIGGIFICGIIEKNVEITSLIDYVSSNNASGNLLASVVGSLMYFGSIVGVTIVSTLHSFGMHSGPAMALLLSAPAVSLPSVLALIPVAGKLKSVVFLALVVVFSALSGFIFGAA